MTSSPSAAPRGAGEGRRRITRKDHVPTSYHIRLRRRGVGDTVAVTPLIRDLYAQYPDIRISVDGSASEDLFRYDYRVSRTRPAAAKLLELDLKETVDRSNTDGAARYLYALTESFERATGLRIERGPAKPSLVLGPHEETPPYDEPYRVVASGAKVDMPVKQWGHSNHRKVVEAVGGKWVQLGQFFDGRFSHQQCAIPGAVNLLGKTSIREMVRIIAHAKAVLCHVSLSMLIAAAFDVPCVVPAGGRENPWLHADSGVDYIDTIGKLSCCVARGCGTCSAFTGHTETGFPDGWFCKDPVTLACGSHVGRCMTLITPEDVTARLLAKQLP